MSSSEPSPEIGELFIRDEELAEVSGVPSSDPLLSPGGGRLRSALTSLGTGVGGGLVAALVLQPGLRWPAGVAVVALALGALSVLVEVGEAAIVAALVAIGALVWLALSLAETGTTMLWLGAAVLVVAGLSHAASRALRARRRRRRGYEELDRLRVSIARYNALVRVLDVKDRLARARGLPGGEESGLAAVLRNTRGNLLRAVRVQRILRENPDVVGQAAALRVEDLVPIEALRIEHAAETYAELVTDTVELAADVQRAYDELRAEPR